MAETKKQLKTKNQTSPAGAVEAPSENRIRIKVRSYDHKVIDQSCRKIIETAVRSGAEVRGPVPLPTQKNIFTVNRSPFIDKDARDQFEMRVHKRLIDIVNPKAKTIDDLMNLAIPAGVDVEVKM